MKCSSCGFESPEGFKFCGQCGTPFAESAAASAEPVDQRRTVTILFADVSGFTALSERLDPETVRDIMDGCFERLTSEIQAMGGTIDKFIGDAVMALFGAPVAHGDDPERAVRAAIGMQQAVKQYSVELQSTRGLELGIRIGINTGRVVWGRVGGTAGGTFTVMGDAVNLASRLEEAAPVGGILLGESTYKYVRDAFELTPLDPVDFKGKAEPVPVYRVDGIGGIDTARAAPVSGPRTPFVGRTTELRLLEERLGNVRRAEQAASVTFVAPAGGGKSRLLAEFRTRLRSERALVLLARAPAFGHGSVWTPWANLLRRAADLHDEVDRDAGRDALNEWIDENVGKDAREFRPFLELLAGVDDPNDKTLAALRDNPKELRAMVNEHGVSFLELLCRSSPTVLIAEDLQWWSSPSLELLRSVSDIAGSLFVVAVSRPFDSDLWPPQGERHVQRELAALGTEEVVHLVSGILGDPNAVTPWLALRVTDLSAGNPFFAEEIVQTLIDQGLVEQRAGSWIVHEDRLGTESLPQSVEGVVQARLDSLESAEARLLSQAAAAGRVFWDHLLTDAFGLTGVEGILQHLIERDFIYPRKRSRFPGMTELAFRHALIRQVAYHNSLHRDRKEAHRKVADWLLAVAREGDDSLSEDLAEHYLKAEAFEDALPHVVAAGERALGAYATTVAKRHLDRAAEILGPRLNESEERSRLRLRARWARGRLHRYTGSVDEAIVDLTEGIEVAEALSSSAELARLHIEMAGSYYQRARFDRVGEHGREALQASRSANARGSEATALNLLAMAARHENDYEAAFDYYDQALHIDRELGNGGAAGARLGNIGNLHLDLGDYLDAIKCYREALGQPLRKETVPVVESNLGLALVLSGDAEAALDSLDQAVQKAEALGFTYFLAEARIRRGAALVLTGMTNEGFEELEEGLSQAIETKLYEPQAEGLWLKARLLSASNRLDEASEVIQACEALVDERNLTRLKQRVESEANALASRLKAAPN